jgi:hypothetical protein
MNCPKCDAALPTAGDFRYCPYCRALVGERPTVVITLRITPEQHEAIKEAARRAKASQNKWAVAALMEVAQWS